jgi:hypothetical protein
MIQSKIQGVGLGLRQPHLPEILNGKPKVPWLEVLADNFFGEGNSALRPLEQLRSSYPISFHCVGMNLGSVDPLDQSYFKKLKELRDRFEPEWVSDHLCWTSVNGRFHHDLLPLPYTEEVVRHVSERIMKIQELLGQRILIENVSSYLRYRDSELEEWEFLNQVAQRSDCLILLDINNIFVNANNHSFSPQDYFLGIATDRVRQFHLGGYEAQEGLLVDTHGAPVSSQVWELYAKGLKHFGTVPTSIERDNSIPDFPKLWDEAKEAEKWMREII